MSEPTTTGAAGTAAPTTDPANPPPAPAPAAAPPTAPTPPAEETISLSSEAFKARLDRAREAERADLLKQWGVTSPDEVKAALAAARERAEAQKTLEERLATETTARQQDQAELQRYRETVTQRAEAEFAGLTEAQQAAVTKLAGDDPAKRLSAIDTLRPTWVTVPAVPPAPATGDEPPKTSTTPATTSVTTTPPNPAGTPAPTDLRATYERLNSDPRTQLQAAALLARHAHEIYPNQ